MGKITQIIFCTALISVLLVCLLFVDYDVLFQNNFYDFGNARWFVDSNHNFILHSILYSNIKRLIILGGIAALLLFAASFKKPRLRSYRYGLIVFILSLALVPAVLAGLKKYTHVYCPYQLQIYNGKEAHLPILSRYPANYDFNGSSKGRCFPAGHASGGFALMALFFCFKRRRNRILGLLGGLSIGWIMGGYQVIRGEHFLSHTLVSMLGAWLIILAVSLIADKLKNKYPAFFQ